MEHRNSGTIIIRSKSKVMKKRNKKLKPSSRAQNFYDYKNNEDEEKIDSPAKLMKLIDRVFSLAKALQIKNFRHQFWEKHYHDLSIYAVELKQITPNLMDPPVPIKDNKQNLVQLRRWCINPSGQTQSEREIIEIESWPHSNSATWRLFVAIANDDTRRGVECQNSRTLRSLKESFKKKFKETGDQKCLLVADSLKWKDKKAWTTIGKIIIMPKK